MPDEYDNSLHGMQSIFKNESGPVRLTEDYLDYLRVIEEYESIFYQYFSEIDVVDESGESLNTKDIIESNDDSLVYLDI